MAEKSAFDAGPAAVALTIHYGLTMIQNEL
jgi:hypothetical protein